MRLLLLVFIGLLSVSVALIGQVPGSINYQAALRQADGKPIAKETYQCSFEFIVGGEKYTQTLQGVTDDFGVLNLQLGGGHLANLDWSGGNATILAEFVGPTTFNDTVLLAAVPYALYAETSGSSIPGPAPAHEWDGSRLRFEKPDGTFGEYRDLQGPQGNSVNVVGSVPTPGELPDGQSNEIGDLIFVESNGDGYVWNGENWINLGRIQGPKGEQGDRGQQGPKGDKPAHQWSGTSLTFENPDGTFGQFVDLKGDKGDDGEVGQAPEHQWMSSQLRFMNPNGSWGEWINLKGEQGEVGPSPEHQWNQSALRFRNPDGSWGAYTNLLGPEGPEGEKGDKPEHQWSGTSVRFENPDGTFGPYIDLKGPQGNSVTVVGSVATVEDLPDGSNSEIGDMIIVAETGEGYVWTGTDWVNVGQVQGPQGEVGPSGPAPEHQWSQNSLRFRNPDGSWGDFTDLKGEQGDQGTDGLAPEHEWNQTGLRFRNPDGTWGDFTDLQGPEGEMGLAPEHQWNQTALRFRNPDSSWGSFSNLKGEQGDQGLPGQQGPPGEQGAQGEQGEDGLAPEHQWNQSALRFRNPDGSWGSFTNLKGDQGEPGEAGPSNELAIGNVTSGDNPQAQITGESPNQILNLVLPKGDPGQDGAPGPPNTLTIGTVQSGTTAQAAITGQAPNQQLNLVLPQGPQGEQGIPGEQGPQGDPGPPGASSAEGDVTGSLNNTTVEKIRGTNVAPTTPTEGQLMFCAVSYPNLL